MRSFYDLLHTSAYSGLCGSLMYLGLKAQCSELRSLCRGHRNHDDVPGYRSSLHLLRDHHGSSDDQHQRFWSGASECLEHQVFPDIPMPEIRGFRLPGYLRQKHATAHVCVMQILAQTDTSTSYVGSTRFKKVLGSESCTGFCDCHLCNAHPLEPTASQKASV